MDKEALRLDTLNYACFECHFCSIINIALAVVCLSFSLPKLADLSMGRARDSITTVVTRSGFPLLDVFIRRSHLG